MRPVCQIASRACASREFATAGKQDFRGDGPGLTDMGASLHHGTSANVDAMLQL